MACRATESDVKSIMQTALSEEELTPFLRSANALVTARLAGQYDAPILVEIETWLAAWAAAQGKDKSGAATSQTIGPVSVSYGGGASGLDLSSNRYGQMVKMLDYKGILSRKGVEVSIETLG
jgi:hypothetical protein